MKKLIYIIPFFILSLTSCEQDANVDLPEVDAQLVINCFITPQDSFVRARISKSMPVFGAATPGIPLVTDATVTVYGNSSSVQLTYNSSDEVYEAATSLFPIIAGNEYRIVVTEPGGLRAEATTTVPLNGPSGFTCTAEDTITQSDPWSSSGQTRYTFTINDPAGVNNYYRFISYDVHYDQWSVDSTMQRTGWMLFTDENHDGETLDNRMTSWFYSSSSDSIIAHKVFAMHCNYDYYRFHMSISNYTYGDPFSEPSFIYDNVTDGLGIFAAANSTVIRIPY